MENTPYKIEQSIEIEDNKLKEIIEPILKEKFEEHFINGLKAGWNTAINEVYNQIKDMTSAKEIKRFLKEKIDRIEKENK